MKVVEISSSKIDKMYDLVEEILSKGGKLMSCIERLSEEMYESGQSRHDDDEDDDNDRRKRMSRNMDSELSMERRYRSERR